MSELENLPLKEDKIKLGFETETVTLQIDQIIPLKVTAPNIREKVKYKQIFASIKEVGIIEPPAVTPCNDKSGRYYLLDGHLRIEALKDLKQKQVTCLISTDDEAFTYNKHINRLSTIQEHKMIVRAVERGVSEEKIAKALNVDVRSIILKRKMLDGVCKEAVDMLKDKMVSGGVFRILKKMKPMRQIECAELMNSMNVYTVPYAKALLAGTPKERLSEPEKPRKIKGIDEEQMARMQSEMLSLQNEYNVIEDTLGSSVLNLTVAKGYVSKLMDNAKVVRYLAQNYPEILEEFQKITEMQSINAKDQVEETV
jgi:ParB-like chromosome segregation protein Spo0J